MARCRVNLARVTSWILGIMASGRQMLVNLVVVAQSSQTSQQTKAKRLYEEGERFLQQFLQQGTRESLQPALAKYQEALPLFRVVGDRAGEAKTLNNIGNLYLDLGQPQQALNYYQQSLPIGREVGDLRGEANTLNNIGLAYSTMGNLQETVESSMNSSGGFSNNGRSSPSQYIYIPSRGVGTPSGTSGGSSR